MERKVLISISEILIFKILNGFFTIEFHKNFEGKSSLTITILWMDDITKRFNTLKTQWHRAQIAWLMVVGSSYYAYFQSHKNYIQEYKNWGLQRLTYKSIF
jgi:hypothetical protein